jgi:hypothetical protein
VLHRGKAMRALKITVLQSFVTRGTTRPSSVAAQGLNFQHAAVRSSNLSAQAVIYLEVYIKMPLRCHVLRSYDVGGICENERKENWWNDTGGGGD